MYCWIKQFGDALYDQFSEFTPSKTTASVPNTSVKHCPQSLCSIPEQECQSSPGPQPPGLQRRWRPPRLTTQAASSAQPARAGAAGLSPASSHLSGISTTHCEQIPFAWDLLTSEAKESRDGSDQSCLWFIQEQLFAVALEIAVSSPSPGTFIEPGWSNSILAQQTPRSTLPSSQQLKGKTTGGHFWLWLRVLRYTPFQSTLLIFFSMDNKADFEATSKFWKEKGKRRRVVYFATLAGCRCTWQTVHDTNQEHGPKDRRD